MPQVLVHDVGDFVPQHPWAVLEIRFRGASIGFEKKKSRLTAHMLFFFFSRKKSCLEISEEK